VTGKEGSERLDDSDVDVASVPEGWSATLSSQAPAQGSVVMSGMVQACVEVRVGAGSAVVGTVERTTPWWKTLCCYRIRR
jgi:anti-sigma-K factor RskA